MTPTRNLEDELFEDTYFNIDESVRWEKAHELYKQERFDQALDELTILRKIVGLNWPVRKNIYTNIMACYAQLYKKGELEVKYDWADEEEVKSKEVSKPGSYNSIIGELYRVDNSYKHVCISDSLINDTIKEIRRLGVIRKLDINTQKLVNFQKKVNDFNQKYEPNYQWKNPNKIPPPPKVPNFYIHYTRNIEDEQ